MKRPPAYEQPPHVVATRIRQKRQGFSGSFMLVEGDDDQRLWLKHVDGASCKVAVCHGRPGVLAVLHALNEGSLRDCLGVVDSDFHRVGLPEPLLQKYESTGDLVVWDHNDMETTLFCYGGAKDLITEYGTISAETDLSKVVGEFCSEVVGLASRIGRVRCASRMLSVELDFEGLDVAAFIDVNLTWNEDGFRRHVQEVGRKGVIAAEFWETAASLNAPAETLSQGHDLVDVCAVAFRRRYGSRRPAEVTREVLEAALRLGFSAARLSMLRLHAGIRSWEAATGLRVF